MISSSVTLISFASPYSFSIKQNKDLKKLLIEALKKLPEKMALVIQLYYVEELNVYEIAEVLEVTIGRVSQIKSEAVKKLRTHIAEAQSLGFE